MAKLCHVPFDAATSEPMTVSNFSRSCFDIGELSVNDDRFLTITSAIRSSKPGPFLDQGVRLRVVLPDESHFYIDDAGGVAIAGSYSKMDPAGFFRVKREVRRLAREKGMIGVD